MNSVTILKKLKEKRERKEKEGEGREEVGKNI
jgi:hypothetical protein